MSDDQSFGASWQGAGWPEPTLESPGNVSAQDSWEPGQLTAPERDSAPAGDSGFWPEQGSASWTTVPPAGWPGTPDGSDETVADETLRPNAAASDLPGLTSPLRRANALIDELREVLAGLEPSTGPNLSRVISDLEVAVRPPGAIAPERLAELRDALMRARERPRDLDTVVDLSSRVGLMVELMFAYDRSIAAIERSLAVLRPTGDMHPGAAGQEPLIPPD